MSTHIAAAKPSRVAVAIRRLSVLMILAWPALTVLVNVVVPQLEEVGKANSVSLASRDAPSYRAIKRQGAVFEQFDSDSMVMVLLESEKPLGDEAREYYHGLVQQLKHLPGAWPWDRGFDQLKDTSARDNGSHRHR